MSGHENGDRVATTHTGGRMIYGTVTDAKPRGMFSVAAYLVDWDDFGPVWESPDSLEGVAR